MNDGKILDYRESHTRKGKGKVYHDSFSSFPFRREIWEWEKIQIEKVLTQKLNPDSSVLDFACGTGRILRFLDTQTKNLTGVDISDAMLEVSKKDLPHLEIIKADLTRDNIFKGKREFDVITAFRFFLNAQDSLRIEVLDVFHDILKEDGILIFNNHGNRWNFGTILGRWVLVKNLWRKPENKIYNYHTMSDSKIKSLLKDAGFEIVDTYHRSIIPITNEKTKFDITKLDRFENWFSKHKFFKHFARNVIYICKKTS